uniref:Ribosome maturation factor RimM n=1 Tax=Lygus hesperus TaxID=30085 RepID=A0A0A9XPQ8_LYGHE
MELFVLLLIVPAALSAFDEFWITPCGHVYKKTVHPLRVVRNAQTLIRLKHQFKATHEFFVDNDQLGILEDLIQDPSNDAYVVQSSTLDLYNHIPDVKRLMSLLPMTYRTLQDLAFALKVVHDELSTKENEEFKKRHIAVTELMDKNAMLLCELDFAMNRNNIDFSRIDQLTMSQSVMTDFKDLTFTHIKHSHILKEYRTFIKQVSAHIMKLV